MLAVVAFGASPVGSVSSGSDFTLHGVRVATGGVPTWPVMAGDSILAGTTPAKIRFLDGSVVTLDSDSSAKVEQTDSGLLLRLISGSMAFTVAPNSSLALFSGQTAVQAVANVEATVATAGAPSIGNRATPAVTVSRGPGVLCAK